MKTNRITTRIIVLGGMFVTIALLLGGGIQRLTGIPTSININLAGARQSIDLSVIPLAISGVSLGPIGALFVGLVYDNLGFLLFKPGSVYNPIFSAADILAAFAPALFYKYGIKNKEKNNYNKLIFVSTGVYTFVAIVLASFITSGNSSQQAFAMITYDNGLKVANAMLLMVIVIIMCVSLGVFWYLYKQNEDTTDYFEFSFDKIYILSFLAIIPRSLVSGFGLFVHFKYVLNTPIPLAYFLIQRMISGIIVVPIIAMILFSMRSFINKVAAK